MPYCSRSCSVASPSETVHSRGIAGLTNRHPSVVETIALSPAAYGRSGFCTTHGARLMDSTPPTSTTSASPSATCREPAIAASRLEPQRRFTVVPGTEAGRPASRAAMRATLRFSSPAPLALPSTTSSTAAGSSAGVRAARPRAGRARRGRPGAPREGPAEPSNGVRTASRTKTSRAAAVMAFTLATGSTARGRAPGGPAGCPRHSPSGGVALRPVDCGEDRRERGLDDGVVQAHAPEHAVAAAHST